MKKPWFHILLSLAAADRYGADIQEDVRALSRGSVRLWPATLYGALEELCEAGLIRELASDEQPDPSGGRERFYRITPGGRDALGNEVERLEDMARVARNRLGGQGAGA
jgi:DNA-binding PadR family transcriptional regulator